jgi:hypothetical protein
MLLRPDRCGNYPRHMCGRYASFLPAEAIARIFGTVNPLPNPLAILERRADAGRDSCSPPPRHRRSHLDMLEWFAAALNADFDRIRCCRVALEVVSGPRTNCFASARCAVPDGGPDRLRLQGEGGAVFYSGLATGRGNGASRTKPMTQVISSTRTWACAL